jgi:ATP-dependent DNA helicase RecG
VAEADATSALARVLLPPLRFAARNDYAGVERLRGFAALARRALDEVDGVSAEVRQLVLEAADGFDDAPPGERRARVARLLTHLGEEAPQLAAPRAPPRDVARRDVDVDVLDDDVGSLPGVGPRGAEALHARGLATIGDLLSVLPRAYEDRRQARSLGDLTPGPNVVVTAEILASGRVGGGRGKRWEVLLDDGTGRLKLVFFRFNPFQMKQRYPPGAMLTATGDVQQRGGQLQMVHPKVSAGSRGDAMSGVWPVYPEVQGLHPTQIARAVYAAVQRVVERPPPEPLPAAVREAAGVIDLVDAWAAIHAPPEDLGAAGLESLTSRTAPAFRRLAFEELFALQLALALRRRLGREEPAIAVDFDDDAIEPLAGELLPFTLTGAQRRSTSEVAADLRRGTPMARLLQGDVGAGKTAVAALACLAVARDGGQAAVMAPTEILAEQHRATLTRWLEPLGVEVAFLSGALRGKARRAVTERVQRGDARVVVGTHALLSDDVRFARLALCVIDEQHRFGVAQRAGLRDKGARNDDDELLVPHLLVMTATPIPRSLALTYYGDLAVSVLDEMPPGRTPVATEVVSGKDKAKAWEAIQRARERGERSYVIYPLIEESEKIDLMDATRGYEALCKRLGPERVALVHGRLPSDEREEVMRRFAGGDVDVLVSTTVVEVGVDVPEATCMVVVNAERFGLSQLHQLRGRVGRSERKSSCWLIAGSGGPDTARRLEVMAKTTDGFQIADEDLAIRGPGDFLGTRQSGLPTLLFSDFARHAELIELARRLAFDLVEEDPELQSEENARLKKLVKVRFADRLALTGAG